MNEIDWDKAEVLLIHECAWGKFKGNKVKLKYNLPSKCAENLCGFYATYYGTCIKTGDKCTNCDHKMSFKSKARPSSVRVGESLIYNNAKDQKVEVIVTAESKTHVSYIEIMNGQEQMKTTTRGTYIQMRAFRRKEHYQSKEV